MKKFLLMITMFLCMMPTVFGADYIFNGEELPATSSYQDTYYGVETMQNILDDLEIPYDDTTILSYTYYTNKALSFWRATHDENTTPLNIIFASTTSKDLKMIPANGSFDDDLNYVYINPDAATSYGRINAFVSWNYNSTTGAISGVNTANTQFISLTTSNYSIANSSVNYDKDESDSQNGSSLYFKYILAPIETYTVASNSDTTGYSWYFLSNLIRFTEEPEIDIPSGDTGGGDTGGGDTGGGTGSTDLKMTNAKIDELNKHAEEILNKMPSSGDIEQATQNGVVQGNTDYWGSSGDLSGDEQEELISGKVDELTEQISGDLAENEIFGILQKYENKIFGGFTGEEDFKIEWNDISYMGAVLIPKGEINFSQMCRDNETLGNVKTTVNIILGFFLLSNCVIYLYNLLLATLGIDNPYLYETPPEEVNTVTYDTNMHTGVTTEIKTSRKRDGTTFRTRRKF